MNLVGILSIFYLLLVMSCQLDLSVQIESSFLSSEDCNTRLPPIMDDIRNYLNSCGFCNIKIGKVGVVVHASCLGKVGVVVHASC